MIPVKFYRNDSYVYVNNPDGTTSKMTLEEFKQHFSGGSGGLPEYDSGNAGEVLAVDSDGNLAWISLPPGGGLVVNITNNTMDKTYNEIKTALASGLPVTVVVENTASHALLGYMTECYNPVEGVYMVTFGYYDINNTDIKFETFDAESENSYPARTI